MSLQISQADVDGVLLGADTNYSITEIAGFGLDRLRTFDRVNPASPGGYGGRDLQDIKRLRFVVKGKGVSIDDLAAKFNPHESDDDAYWLRFRWSGMADTRRVLVRPDLLDHTLEYSATRWEAKCEWRAVDPRFYSDTETVENVAQASSGGGWEFPWVFPWTFGSGGSGTVQLVNEGLADTFMVATITGPCGGPRLEHVGLGLQVNMAGLTLAAGETVVVDFQNRTVLLNGTSDRYNTLTSASRFFPLQPGSNEVRFATATGSSATAELRYRSAWNIGGS